MTILTILCGPQNVDSPEITFADTLVRFDQYFNVNMSTAGLPSVPPAETGP